jgi:hypothetical protein
MALRLMMALNLMAVLLFVIAFMGLPVTSTFDARIKFMELDRAGVINTEALRQFHPDRGFGGIDNLEYRATLPAWIAGGSLSNLRMITAFGAIIAFTNVGLIAIALWIRQHKQEVAADLTPRSPG